MKKISIVFGLLVLGFALVVNLQIAFTGYGVETNKSLYSSFFGQVAASGSWWSKDPTVSSGSANAEYYQVEKCRKSQQNVCTKAGGDFAVGVRAWF